jgi:alpha-glucosidase (family GH31 glycosyl hydrolase)
MVSPVVEQGATTVDVYFPQGFWYDFWTGELTIKSSGDTITLQAPLDTIQVHILGGTIIPMQEPGYTLAESRLNPFSLLVAFDANSQVKTNFSACG